jgi:hypothetical protein
MFPNKRIKLERLFAFMTAATSALCGANASAEPPVAPVPSHALAKCTVTGSPRVMATKVAPGAGIEAEADANHVWLRFARKANAPLLALAVEPESLDVIPAGELAVPKFDRETPFAGVDLRQALWETSLWAEEETSRAPAVGESADMRIAGPVVTKMDDGRSMWAWTVGSIYTGVDIRVLTVGPHGEALGAPLTLPHEGSVMGSPAVAVAPSGRGVVAFMESNATSTGFQIVAASLDCGAPSSEPVAPAWALATSR